jgi:hypothetical protein
MLREPKTLRHKYLSKIISVILILYCIGYSFRKIATESDIPKSIIIFIVRRTEKYSDFEYIRIKRFEKSFKFIERAKRKFIRFIDNYPFETIEYFIIFFKSGYRMYVNTARRYFAKYKIYIFRPRRKPFLNARYKREKFIFIRYYFKWDLPD